MRPRALVSRCLLAAALVGLVTTAGWAQTVSSAISGTLKDRDGRPAPEATVTARSDKTGTVRTVVTDRDGHFRFDLLAPGAWILVARGKDGDTSETRTVVVHLQQVAQISLTLGKGLTEKVSVQAEAPVVDPQRIDSELRIGETQVDTLPIAGRVVTDLATLDASVGAASPGDFVGERGSVFIVKGSTGRSNSFLVDGLDNNDRTSGTTMNAYFSPLVIKEFVVLTRRFAAEFGRASGGVLNIVTDQGSNELTADLFVQGTPATWNAPGGFVSTLPRRDQSRGVGSRYDAGFKIGGPIVEDRAFYFVAAEEQRSHDIVPYVGVGRDGIAGGWAVAPNRDGNLFFRTDFNLSPTQLLMVRLSGDDRTTHDLNVGGAVTPEAGFLLRERDEQLAASLTSVLSPRLLNEARLLVSASSFHQYANSDQPGVDRPFGAFGGNNLNRQLRDEDKVQVVDNLTWRAGSHTLKTGVDVTRSRTWIRTRFNPNGNFLYDTDRPFNPGSCGVLASDIVPAIQAGTYPIIPCPDGNDADISTYPIVYMLIKGSPAARLFDTQLGLFAQDSWQIHPKFLLEYGLRYDVSTFHLPEGTRVPSTIPNGGAGVDRDNLGPRLGFTYTPGADGKLVIRGGGGIFYDKVAMGFPAVAAITSGTRIGILPLQGLTLEITEATLEDPVLGPIIRDVIQFPQKYVMRFSTGTRLETPYSTEFSLGAERSVGSGGSVKAELTRAQGYHLPLMRDLNPVVSCISPGQLDPSIALDVRYRNVCDPTHRDDTWGSISSIVTEGRSWYTGLDLGWRWHGRMGWYSASYTLSRALDLGSDPLKGGISLPPNSDDLGAEKGPSDADRRHRLVLSGESALPWMGLRASGVFQVSSGIPYNVTTGRDDNLDGITTDRPPLLGQANSLRPAEVGRNLSDGTPLGAVNAYRSAFGLPPLARLPKSPAFIQVDLRVSKPFFFDGSRGRGDVFVQVFNLLDRFNEGPIEGRIVSPNFGKAIGQVGPPRTLEFGMKVGF